MTKRKDPNVRYPTTDILARIVARVVEVGECREWTGAYSASGYPVIQRGRRGEGVVRVLRYLWESAHGTIPPKMLMCHKCDNKRCVNLSHVYMGTYSDNIRDAWERGQRKYAVERAQFTRMLKKAA